LFEDQAATIVSWCIGHLDPVRVSRIVLVPCPYTAKARDYISHNVCKKHTQINPPLGGGALKHEDGASVRGELKPPKGIDKGDERQRNLAGTDARIARRRFGKDRTAQRKHEQSEMNTSK